MALEFLETARSVVAAGNHVRGRRREKSWQGAVRSAVRSVLRCEGLEDQLNNAKTDRDDAGRPTCLKTGYGISRMCTDAEKWRARVREAALEFELENQIGELGLRIGAEHRLIDTLGLEVVEFDFALIRDPAGDSDDPRARPLLQVRIDEGGEQEGTEVIGGELALVSRRR
jgi:hypothetical protein